MSERIRDTMGQKYFTFEKYIRICNKHTHTHYSWNRFANEHGVRVCVADWNVFFHC
jgi:hypothetical protein